jgi:hypothetical protein
MRKDENRRTVTSTIADVFLTEKSVEEETLNCIRIYSLKA